MRGQLSSEFTVIIGTSLLLITVFLALSSETLLGIGSRQVFADARESVNALAHAADRVALQGEGASAEVRIRLPQAAVFNQNYTYIGRPANSGGGIQSNTIAVRVGESDIFATTRQRVSGAFPMQPGYYAMEARFSGGAVEIRENLISIGRQAVSVSMPKNSSRIEGLMVYKPPSSRNVSVQAYASWGYNGTVNLTLSPGSFTAAENGTWLILSFSASQNASGTYNSNLYIDASCGVACVNDSHRVPISIRII